MKAQIKQFIRVIVSSMLALTIMLGAASPVFKAAAQEQYYDVCFWVTEKSEDMYSVMLENAYIYVYDSEGELVDSSVTWQAGETWIDLQPGEYTAYATVIGYTPKYQDFTVSRDERMVSIELDYAGLPVYSDSNNIKTGETVQFHIEQDTNVLSANIIWVIRQFVSDTIASEITPFDGETGISSFKWDTTGMAPGIYKALAYHCLVIGTNQFELKQDSFDPSYCTITEPSYTGSVMLDTVGDFSIGGTEYSSIEVYEDGQWKSGPFEFDTPGKYELEVRYRGNSGAYTSTGKLSFEITAPQSNDDIYPLQSQISAYAGEVFYVDISTPANVTGIGIRNENGNFMGKALLESSPDPEDEGRLIWKVGLIIPTVSEKRRLYIYTKTDGDYVDSGEYFDVKVDKKFAETPPAQFAETSRPVSIDTTQAFVNQAIIMKVKTNIYTQNIKLANESGRAMGKLAQSYVDKDGEREWTIAFCIGTKGAARVFTVSVCDVNGVYNEQTYTTPEITVR